ncbi:MAG: hypothetical protein CVT62_11045 [Actinobacteria bacterium HGW-Actinobacteria-2]|nr:MAG: hypothetical protein CVT62_11045 [Actinobacteria bacterium HGW-Actinobacteria-2]
MPYERLDADAVAATAQRLAVRIQARFPDRNLGEVAGRVAMVTSEVERTSARSSLMRVLRVVGLVLIVVLVAVAAVSLVALAAELIGNTGSTLGWLEAVETSVNDLVFAGVAVAFLWLLPARVERARILGELHRLRSLAHVIDMHQLTKDPERFDAGYTPTDSSVRVGLSSQQMSSYLEYCSELLSLVAKTAALYAERTTDAAVLATISDIENLTTGMSRKIWQKLALLPRSAVAAAE